MRQKPTHNTDSALEFVELTNPAPSKRERLLRLDDMRILDCRYDGFYWEEERLRSNWELGKSVMGIKTHSLFVFRVHKKRPNTNDRRNLDDPAQCILEQSYVLFPLLSPLHPRKTSKR